MLSEDSGLYLDHSLETQNISAKQGSNQTPCWSTSETNEVNLLWSCQAGSQSNNFLEIKSWEMLCFLEWLVRQSGTCSLSHLAFIQLLHEWGMYSRLICFAWNSFVSWFLFNHFWGLLHSYCYNFICGAIVTCSVRYIMGFCAWLHQNNYFH